jgi:Rad3-related DNA helicase
MTARKKVIQGGTSAGKTLAILAVLIDIAAKNKT